MAHPRELSTREARTIVLAARRQTRLKSVRNWLEMDERGVWETEARRVYALASESPVFHETEWDVVVEQCAVVVAACAAETLSRAGGKAE